MRLTRGVPGMVFGLMVSLALGGPGRADTGPSSDKLGSKIDNVTFRTAAGKPVSLETLRGKKATVIVFLSFDCPVSTSYSQPLALLYDTYKGKGVTFVAVVPGADEKPAEVARQAREYKIPFPVFQDADFRAADALKAGTTPSAFVLDHNRVLRYRGRIDNGYYARLKKNQKITSFDLRDALDDVLAGRPVRRPVSEPVGCPIQRERETKVTSNKVTYYRDVLPILQSRCQTCHRPGEVGPFSLMTLKQAVSWADDIKEYTRDRKMPPWKPTAGVPFHNERRLTGKEIATLAAWVDNGKPAGDPKDAPPPRRFTDGWQLGPPDLVLTLPEDFQVGPSGRDIFRCFVLPTNLTQDKYVTAVDIRPSNPRVVHHALLFIDTRGRARRLEKDAQARQKATDEDRGPGYSSRMGVGFAPQGGLSGWAPGQMPRFLPPETGYFLPKGSDVVMQVHYHRDGRTEKDRTRVGLYFARKPVKKPFKSMVLPGGGRGLQMFFTVPAGQPDFKLRGHMWVEQDCTLYTVMPHMHLVGKAIKVTVTPPGAKPFTLVEIKDWDYNWQETYLLKKPIRIKAGTRFDVEAIYDNSDKNVNNPFHPPQNIYFGEQTTNEMCFVFLGATSDKPGRILRRFDGQRLRPLGRAK